MKRADLRDRRGALFDPPLRHCRLRQKATEDDFSSDEIESLRESNRQHPDRDTDEWPEARR